MKHSMAFAACDHFRTRFVKHVSICKAAPPSAARIKVWVSSEQFRQFQTCSNRHFAKAVALC
jgi:hypothetical protein